MRNSTTIIILAGLLAATGCKRQDRWLTQFEKGDISFIECGKGSYSQHQIHLAEKDSRILKTAEILPETAKEYFNRCLVYCAEDSTAAGRDVIFTGILGDDQGRIFLTYMAAYSRPKIMAGKRIQIVLSRQKELEKILVYDIPLEK